MKLQNRDLASRMRGDDVTALQKELKKLGYKISDKSGYFGKSTRLAVLEFQRQNKLKPTGVVDKRTASALTKALAAQGKPKQPRRIRILGRVLDRATREGVAGLRVEAWDKDLLVDDLLGSTTTDNEGAFTLDFDEAYYKEICFDRKPDVYFKVFHGKKLIASTEDSVRWNVEKGDVKVEIRVSLEQHEEKRIVRGIVVDSDRYPLGDLQVQAVRRNLRQEILLGSAKTDDQGQYKIPYTVTDASAVNLSIKVLDREENLLHQTEIYHDVPKDVTIDVLLLEIVSGYSEFE
ncbi:MAG: peptidoglycan-binding domain-containing protein, partial [Anaerolineales bacterium]